LRADGGVDDDEDKSDNEKKDDNDDTESERISGGAPCWLSKADGLCISFNTVEDVQRNRDKERACCVYEGGSMFSESPVEHVQRCLWQT